MKYSLAIIIPAYKPQFFDAALQSLAGQTNKNFRVYVGDDASPADLKAVADTYTSQLDIVYHRFAENWGKKNLAQHWNRSVELADEEWIWLFSDDDLMLPDCVQAFFDAVEATESRYNIYRFNIEMIDGTAQVIGIKQPHPVLESGYEFAVRRLESKSLSAAIEYVFKKEVFKTNNGFVCFPLAFCADDATWIKFAGDKPIYTISSKNLYWRVSGLNVSSVTGLHIQKIEAMLMYCEWLNNRYPELPKKLIEDWFFANIKYTYGKTNYFYKLKFAKKLTSIFKKSSLIYFIRFNHFN